MTTLREAAQQAKQVPLRELLASVPADARLVIDDADGKGTRFIPVGRLCQEAAAALVEDAMQKFTDVNQELEAALAEPVQDIEDAIEAAYWHFDARKQGLNEWASAPQSERDAFKAEARKLVRGYFPTRQAQDTKREMLAVADAFIRGQRAALAEPVQEPVQEPVAWSHINGTSDTKWHPPQRKPLSDADLAKIWDDALDQLDQRDQLRFIARAIERAHGVGEQP